MYAADSGDSSSKRSCPQACYEDMNPEQEPTVYDMQFWLQNLKDKKLKQLEKNLECRNVRKDLLQRYMLRKIEHALQQYELAQAAKKAAQQAEQKAQWLLRQAQIEEQEKQKAYQDTLKQLE